MRQKIYGQYKASIGRILRLLFEIHETDACPYHIHMLVSIAFKLGSSSFMGYLKDTSNLRIFYRHTNFKYKYGHRKFWYRGFFVDTSGRNQEQIDEYIRNPLQEDKIANQVSKIKGSRLTENQ